MRTKKVNVEIEIPVDMEVNYVWQIIPENVNINLKQRPPKKLIFEEIVGRDYVEQGEYWVAGPGIVKASGRYSLEENEAAYKLVEEC